VASPLVVVAPLVVVSPDVVVAADVVVAPDVVVVPPDVVVVDPEVVVAPLVVVADGTVQPACRIVSPAGQFFPAYCSPGPKSNGGMMSPHFWCFGIAGKKTGPS
jgi:hypothetical protein